MLFSTWGRRFASLVMAITMLLTSRTHTDRPPRPCPRVRFLRPSREDPPLPDLLDTSGMALSVSPSQSDLPVELLSFLSMLWRLVIVKSVFSFLALKFDINYGNQHRPVHSFSFVFRLAIPIAVL